MTAEGLGNCMSEMVINVKASKWQLAKWPGKGLVYLERGKLYFKNVNLKLVLHSGKFLSAKNCFIAGSAPFLVSGMFLLVQSRQIDRAEFLRSHSSCLGAAF